jgi:hypothetical protein
MVRRDRSRVRTVKPGDAARGRSPQSQIARAVEDRQGLAAKESALTLPQLIKAHPEWTIAQLVTAELYGKPDGNLPVTAAQVLQAMGPAPPAAKS